MDKINSTAEILSIYPQLRREKVGGYDIHAQTKEDFERETCSAPLTSEPFPTRKAAIEWGKLQVRSGAFSELWYEKTTKCTKDKPGKRELIQVL